MKIPWLRDLEDKEFSLLNSCERKLVEDVYSATEKEIQYRVFDPVKDGVEISDKISLVKENLKLIAHRLKLSQGAKKRFMQEYPKWEKIRQRNVLELQNIGNSLHSTRKNCNISRLIGNCTSLVGGGICVASVALTPLTLGLTTPLAIAGGTMTFVGSAASVGTTVAEIAKLKNKVKEANDILKDDKESFQFLKVWLTHACELSETIFAIEEDDRLEGIMKIIINFAEVIFSSKVKTNRSEMVKVLVKSTIQKIPRELIHSTLTANLVSLLLVIALLYNRNHKDFEDASKTLKTISSIVSLVDFSVDILQSASAFIKSDISLTANVSKAVTKGAVALFGMTLDMASIVLTSIDVHKGSLSGEGLKIIETADKLKEESNILEKVYDELRGC